MINVTIADGRKELHQWDIDRILKISGAEDGATVYFIDNDKTDPLPVVITDGKVKIPNSLLQTPRLFLKLFVYDDEHTLGDARLRVIAQPKPEGYITEADDILSWDKLFEACGVYTPIVSSDGVLSWKKSKSTMEDIPSVNIKGATGNDGGVIIRKWTTS